MISILMESRLLFEFMHDVYDEKLRLGEKEIIDRDLNVFFDDKKIQSGVIAGWTDGAVKRPFGEDLGGARWIRRH